MKLYELRAESGLERCVRAAQKYRYLTALIPMLLVGLMLLSACELLEQRKPLVGGGPKLVTHGASSACPGRRCPRRAASHADKAFLTARIDPPDSRMRDNWRVVPSAALRGSGRHDDSESQLTLDPHFCCPVRRRTRVRMGVRTCLHDLQFVAISFSFDSLSLQAVSTESSLLQGFRADF